MAYAYEDEELEETEEIEVDENLIAKEPVKTKKDKKKKKKETEEEFEAVNLDISPNTSHNIKEPKEEKKDETDVKKEEEQQIPSFEVKPNKEVVRSKANNEFIVDNLMTSEVSNNKKIIKEDISLKAEDELNFNVLLNKKDEKFFEDYIGKNYLRIVGRKFNFAAFFFGGTYLVYRKVYVIGIVWIFINLFVSLLFPMANINWIITGLFLIASYIGCGLYANQIILNHVGTRILNLKLKGDKDIRTTLKKSGGTNFFAALLVCMLVGIVNSYIINEQVKKYIQEHPTIQQAIEYRDYVRYDGRVNVDTEFDLKNNISITVPNNFHDTFEENYKYYFVYEDSNNYLPKCSIEFESVIGYKNPYLFVEAITNYALGLPENIVHETINGNDWYYINVGESSRDTYYASTEINGRMYLLKYSYKYNLKEECEIYYKDVLSSIK